MPDNEKISRPAPVRPRGVPPPPTKADIDQISKDQALIADEWAPNPPAEPEKKD